LPLLVPNLGGYVARPGKGRLTIGVSEKKVIIVSILRKRMPLYRTVKRTPGFRDFKCVKFAKSSFLNVFASSQSRSE
jgi:hypothetical protein